MTDVRLLFVCSLFTASLSGCLQPFNSEAASQPIDPNAPPTIVDFNTPDIEIADGGTTTTACQATTIQARAILAADCGGCHEAPQNQGNFNSVLDFGKLVTALSKTTTDSTTGLFVRLLIPGNAEGSRLYLRIRHDEMPPSGMMPRPTLADFSVIQDWITNCLDDSGGVKTPGPTAVGVASATTGADGGRS